MSVGYARCLDCGAETTLVRERVQAPDPAHVTLVPLTPEHRAILRYLIRQEVKKVGDGAYATSCGKLLQLLEG